MATPAPNRQESLVTSLRAEAASPLGAMMMEDPQWTTTSQTTCSKPALVLDEEEGGGPVTWR